MVQNFKHFERINIFLNQPLSLCKTFDLNFSRVYVDKSIGFDCIGL